MSDTTTPTKNESLPELPAADDPIVQMRMVVQTAREHDSLISRTWVSGWADQWEKERAAALTREAPTEAVVRTPSYEALLIIAQSVCGALARAGIEDCDDPGEAIDVMRERLEARFGNDTTTPSLTCDMGVGCDEAGKCYASAMGEPNRCTRGATPPAPQRLAQGDSAVALEVYLSTTWGSAAMRIEALATWLDQQEENCGLLSIAAADLRAMSAKLYSEPTGEGDSWFADALTSMGEVIPLPTQPPHQDRGEVGPLYALADSWDSLAEKFWALGTDVSRAEASSMRNDARELRAALTEAKQQDNRSLAESVFNIPVPTRGFHEGWRDEEIWQWALSAAAAHILGTTQSEAEKLLTTSSTGEPEAKQQGPGEAVAWQQLYGGRWEERSEDQYRYMVRQNAERPGAFTVRALGVIAPKVEAKRQTGGDAS